MQSCWEAASSVKINTFDKLWKMGVFAENNFVYKTQGPCKSGNFDEYYCIDSIS